MTTRPRGTRRSDCNHPAYQPKARRVVTHPDFILNPPTRLRDQQGAGICWQEAGLGCVESLIKDDASGLWGAALANDLFGTTGDTGGTFAMFRETLEHRGYLKLTDDECNAANTARVLGNPVPSELLEQARATRYRLNVQAIDPHGLDAIALIREALEAGHPIYVDGPCNDEFVRRAEAGETLDAVCFTGDEGHAWRPVGYSARLREFYGYTSWNIRGLTHLGSPWDPRCFERYQGVFAADESAITCLWSIRVIVGVEVVS